MMRDSSMRSAKGRAGASGKADVCLIVEGAYPYVAGGVSSWVDWLMRSQSHLSFSVVAISSGREQLRPRYQRPPNQITQHDLLLHSALSQGRRPSRPERTRAAQRLVPVLTRFLSGGGSAELRELVDVVNAPRKEMSLYDLLESREAFDTVCGMYAALMPQASFLQFYWAWRALCGGLFATLKLELPDARIYHAISTGYAGLLAARAAVETGRPALVTEHGIYTNERRIEILMADWISDTVDKGLNVDDPRMDMRDLWIKAFESYARACYEVCSQVTTLYRDNQGLQVSLGAEPERLKVIANGIDVERFAALDIAGQDERPTVALIGRVVPIKDIRTFIVAAAVARREVPDIRALVMGPTEEDPAYADECRQLIAELGLKDCVELTGPVRLDEWLPKVHVVVLTSLSEAQPLVLLEAGAAGVPCVATNVGACREIIEGAGDADDLQERGGFITDLVSPEQVADGVCRLLRSSSLRREMGESLRRRVRRHYASTSAQANYAALYGGFMENGTVRHVGGAS
jgi:glycosyltransferase involved in cell wall biosynthesis